MRLTVMIALLLTAASWSCSRRETQVADKMNSDSAMAADDSMSTVSAAPFVAHATIGPDSPQELERKRQILLSCVPAQRSRTNFTLKDVSKIILFEELGLGERYEIAAPIGLTQGWPSGATINRRIGDAKTTIALRFVLDTLPGPRVPGSARICLMAPHCVEEYGADVTVPGVQAGSGAVTLYFDHRLPMVEADCCDQGPHMALAGFGDFGDTLLALYTFDPQRLEFGVQLIGPRSSRGFPRYRYVDFRTERGGLHPEVTGYPYECRRTDTESLDLVIGLARRQKYDQLEPRLRITIF